MPPEEIAFKPQTGFDPAQLPPPPDPKVYSKEWYPRNYVSPSVYSTGVTTTIYTVPANKVFVLLSAYMSYGTDNAAGTGYMELQTSAIGMPQILMLVSPPSMPAGSYYSDATSIAYGEGVVFREGVVFKLWNGSSFDMVGGLIGYEVNKDAFKMKLI